MSERRAGTKGRRMGSSRRKLLRESPGEAPAAAPSSGEESPWASEMMQKVQDFLREQDKDQAGFITRSDMEKLQEENLPCSREEMELIFDGLDAAGTGRLSTEEFTAGLWQFLSSQKTARHHRRSKLGSRRVRLVIPSPVLEGADSEERGHFAAFMEQLGTDNVSEEQEIWQLWVKLRQDEPQLLGNLEDFLAKMRHRIQEAKSKKEALELTLNKRVAEHNKEVQQLCEALEQQIQQEQQRLQQESMARSHQHDLELQQALGASEREVQRLVAAQKELEARCRSLRSTQQATSTENQQLQESNRVLEDQLQHLHQQLQETQERLQAARAAVAQGHVEQPRYRVVAELPSKTPLSPQTSLEKSEMHHSEMRIRLGSQGSKTKTKSIHQVVWEMPPAEVSFLGPQLRASSTEEDPFPEFLKEEHFSDQSSLLREMNDAIAALNKQLKPQALDAPPALADAAQKPWSDAEPQMGPEAATGHGTPPRVRQETLSSHTGHEMFEGDLKEGPATAELHAPGVTQAGASVGAGHHRAQELGAEQGETLEEAWGMLFLQGKGSGVKELMPKAAEHPQGALGESMEAEERALPEGEGEGWMQERTAWEKAQLLGEAKEAALSQGENLEVGLGPPEAGEAGLAAGWQLGLAAPPEECAQPHGAGLGEEAGPPSGLSQEHEIHPGEHLEPEPPSQGEVRVGASQEDGVLPEVTVAPGPGVLEEEQVSAELQPWGDTLDVKVPPAQHGGSRGAGVEEGKVEVPQPMEAELQLHSESVRGDAGQGGSRGAEVLQEDDNQDLGLAEGEGAAAVCAEGLSPVETPVGSPDLGGMFPVKAQALELLGAEDAQADTQLPGGARPEPPLAGEGPAAMQLVEEAEDGEEGQGECELLQEPLMVLHGTGLGQGGGSGAEEQPGAEADELSPGRGGPAPLPVMTFGVQRPGVEVNGDVEHPEEDEELELVQGEGSKEDGLFLDKSQGLELAEAEDAQTDTQLPGGASPEPPLAGKSPAVMQLVEQAEDGEEGQGEHELLHEPVLDLQGEGAPEGVQPWAEAESLAVLGDQTTDANVQELTEADKLQVTLGGSTESDIQPPSEAGYLDTEQGGSMAPDVEPLDQLDTPESVEKQEAEDAQEDTQLPGGPGPEALQGRGDHAALQLVEKAEDGAQGQGECELLYEPELDLQGEGASRGVQPWAEAESLAVLGDQSTDANVQELTEADKLQVTLGGGTEADLQPPSEAGYLDTEQGGTVAPDVEPLDQLETPDLPEKGEAEDSGQGEDELLHESELDPQGEGASRGVQPWAEAVIQGMLGDQSTDANVSPLLEVDELKSAPGGGTESALLLPREAGYLDTEQGGSVAPGVQLLEEDDNQDLGLAEGEGAAAVCAEGPSPVETPVGSPDLGGMFPVKAQALELVGAEDALTDTQLLGGARPEPPLAGEGPAAMQLVEEAEDGARGQSECELLQEPVLDSQGEGPGLDVQPWAEAVIQGMLGDQSTDANVSLLLEVDELKSAHLQLWSEQGGSMAPDVEPLDQLDTPDLLEKGEAEDSGQGEDELPQKPVLDLQGEGAPEGVQPWAEAESLALLGDQSTDANVQETIEADKLQVTLGGGTEADLQPPSEAGYLDTEQGGSVAPDVEPLDQLDPPEVLEMREAEDSGQGEDELLPESELDPQGEGASRGVQPWAEAVIQGMLGDQSTDANVSLLLEVDELKSAPGGDTEAALQLWSEQGGSVAPDVQPLDQLDPPESVEMREAEDAQTDTQLPGGPGPEPPLAGESPAAMQLVEEAEDGARGQGECELLQEPVLDSQGEGPGLDVQPWAEAVIQGMPGDQSTDANVSLLLEVDELKSAPGGGTESALLLPREAGYLDTEQGGSVAPGVQLLREDDNQDLGLAEGEGAAAVCAEGPSPVETSVGSLDLGGIFPVKAQALELVGAEDTQADTQLLGGASPEPPLAGESPAVMQLVEEAENGEEGQGECELLQEPELQLQGEGPGLDVQPWAEAESLAVLGDQSTDANVQETIEADKLQVTLGGGTEADLQPPSEAGYLDTEQGGSVAPDVEPLDQLDPPEVLEMREAEDSGQGEDELLPESELDPQGEGDSRGVQPWAEAVIQGVLGDQSTDANVSLLLEVDELKSTPGGDTEAALQLWSEQGGSVAPDVQPLDQLDTPDLLEKGDAEDSGQGEDELPQKPVLDLQGEGAPEGVQPWAEAESLAVLGDQSTDANVSLLLEVDELQSTPGGDTESALQPWTKQGGSVAPDVQPLDQLDPPESVEMREAEDAQTDTQLPGGASPEPPLAGEGPAVIQLVEEAEDGARGQSECELLQEPVLDSQGEGPGLVVQPWAEAVIQGMLGDQSTDANVSLLLEVDELKSTPGGGRESALLLPREAGYLDTEQGGSVAPGVQLLREDDNQDLGLAEGEGAAAVCAEGPSPVETSVGSPDLGGMFPVKAQALELVGAEDAQTDTQLPGGASPETPLAGESPAVIQLVEEAEDGEEGQGECELLQEPELQLQGEGPGLDVQPWAEAESLAVLGDQTTDANVQETIEADKLQVTLGGGTEADLQPPSEAGYLDTEQGGTVAPDVEPLDQLDPPEVLEMREAEDSGQGEDELLQESELDPQGEGASRGVQPWAEAVIQGVLGDQSTDANVSLLLEVDELKSTPGGDTEAALQLWTEQGGSVAPDVQPLDQLDPPESVEMREAEDAQTDTQLPGGASPEPPLAGEGPAAMQLVEEAEDGAALAPLGPAGMQEGWQSQSPALVASLHAAHTADMWEGAAGAHMSPLAEATLHPEHAAEGPGVNMMLGALTGADGQTPEDAKTLEIPQGEGSDAEDRPLDGARAVEAVQGGRLEAGVRSLGGTQTLGMKHGHDEDGLPALAPLVSQVPLETSRLQLQTVMQEDVLVPDVWRLGGSGQAAPGELQEQVSAQRAKVKLHTAPQQPEKPLHEMEREQVAARPAEPPKQEVPPASPLHTRVPQEEGAGNDQLGMVLRNSSLRNVAIISMQPQRQLLGEQSQDPHAGQQEKQQEAGWKMSHEGGHSPGLPGPVTAAGAEAALRSSPDALLDPDHLYNVLFVGDSHVGKTSFLYRLHAGAFNPHLTATVGLDYQVKNLVVDNKCFSLRLWDSAGQERYRSITKQYFRKADGVVLMYDITSEYSFSDVRYWLTCIQEGAEDGVGILLLGNKTDCAAERRVPTKEGERLAQEHQLMFYECSAASGHNVSESMVSFIRLLKAREDELKNKVVEEPRPPQKKKGCC